MLRFVVGNHCISPTRVFRAFRIVAVIDPFSFSDLGGLSEQCIGVALAFFHYHSPFIYKSYIDKHIFRLSFLSFLK